MMQKPFALVLMLLSLNTLAQTALIVRTGLNFSNATLNPALPSAEEKGSNGILNAALLADIPVHDMIHLITGVGFENDGYTVSPSDPQENGSPLATNVDQNLDYLTVPIMASFQISLFPHDNGSWPKLFFNAGLEPALLLSATNETTGEGFDETTNQRKNTTPVDVKLRTEMVAESLDLGFKGILSDITAGIVGVGYSYGLINSNATPNSNQTVHNYVIQIFFGLKFGLHTID